MTIVFRQLHAGDREEYLTLMLAAYKPIYALGIPFDAATATLEKVTQHLGRRQRKSSRLTERVGEIRFTPFRQSHRRKRRSGEPGIYDNLRPMV